MAFDTKKWLTEDLGFTADEADTLLPKFGDRADKIEKGYLRQADYSRSMNDLKTLEGQIAKNEAKLNADMAEWAEMTAGEQAASTKLKADIEAAQTRAYQLEQRLKRVAEENGIDPKTVLEGDPTPPKVKEPVAFDSKELEVRINTQLGGIATYMLDLNAELPAIAQEHFDLTGQRLDTRAFIAGIKADIKAGKTDNLDPVKRWEAEHQIPQKRIEKQNADIDTRIKAAREEGRTAGISEAALARRVPAHIRPSGRPATSRRAVNSNAISHRAGCRAPCPHWRPADIVSKSPRKLGQEKRPWRILQSTKSMQRRCSKCTRRWSRTTSSSPFPNSRTSGITAWCRSAADPSCRRSSGMRR